MHDALREAAFKERRKIHDIMLEGIQLAIDKRDKRPAAKTRVRHCMSLGAAVGVLMAAFTGAAWAKGGLSRKEPVPFTKQELILIHECRGLVWSQGMESAAFARKCSSVILYIRH
jgi:hypothetical protein